MISFTDLLTFCDDINFAMGAWLSGSIELGE